MSDRKRKTAAKPEVEKQTDYYDLKTKAVQDLAEADESNSPEVSPEELRGYLSGPKFKIADWAKVLFIKWWFPAAVCFFFFWGLGGYMADQLDLYFVTAIGLGMVTDILTNNVLRFIERTPGEHSRWMMFPKKGFLTFPLNILYSFVLLILVGILYSAVNIGINRITGQPDAVTLGVEPILFGMFYLGFDSLLIGAKHLVQRIVHDAMHKAAQ